MTGEPLPLARDQAAAAAHGQWCPKLCSHTCPVLRATGRSDAVPWSFHRTLADLDEGRLAPQDAAGRLVACTGCRACAGGCDVSGQDVPAQVRAGRAALVELGTAAPAVASAVAHVAEHRAPDGRGLPRGLGAARADVVVLAGCRDESATVTAVVTLLAAADLVASVIVPAGCCGELLRDLGAVGTADDARRDLAARLTGGPPVVVLDPHCRPAVPSDHEVIDLVTYLGRLVGDGALRFARGPGIVRWHEPCAVRGTQAQGEGPAVLAAAHALVELPGEAHHGCSGAGMGLPLLDPDAAAAVASQRADGLRGPGPLVTGCSAAVRSLAGADEDAVHIATLLASLLHDPPESVA